MGAFRYQALEASGDSVSGTIEAEDRRDALSLLAGRGLFPSFIEPCAPKLNGAPKSNAVAAPGQTAGPQRFQLGTGVRRKEVTAFSREMAALLGASIPIPQALDGLGEEEENLALKMIVLRMAESVRKGSSLSAAMDEHPKVFNKLYVSMIRVGEEAGALPKVMNDLAALLEHEDEIRGEVVAAVSYPLFVLGFGIFTVIILLTVVLPKLFAMLQEMLKVLPLPTLILLRTSGFIHRFWPLVLIVLGGTVIAGRWYIRTPGG
ncbi:MAG TPA: type II secretion system F family protein, partial [Verrucomicrobiae bacterium]|nr:type II secretion system F family protein [Verrucomicrobiae bacterium]